VPEREAQQLTTAHGSSDLIPKPEPCPGHPHKQFTDTACCGKPCGLGGPLGRLPACLS
jgi:hypothetical protein